MRVCETSVPNAEPGEDVFVGIDGHGSGKLSVEPIYCFCGSASARKKTRAEE